MLRKQNSFSVSLIYFQSNVQGASLNLSLILWSVREGQKVSELHHQSVLWNHLCPAMEPVLSLQWLLSQTEGEILSHPDYVIGDEFSALPSGRQFYVPV